MIKEKYVITKFTVEGVHSFPAALTDKKYHTKSWDDVSFLGHPHMHYFAFTVFLEVFDNDREVEFIQLNRYLKKLYTDNVIDFDNKSCEMLGEELIQVLKERYPGRNIRVQVFEDNYNGCELFWEKS